MKIGNVEVEETFAEAFPMYASRILITARDKEWCLTAARAATGFASSIIMSPAEAGIERLLSESETPDGRPGVLIHIYQRSVPEVQMQVLARIGQCVLTCATTAVFDGLPDVKRKIGMGKAVAKFGDGFEKKEKIYGRSMWRVPVMEGEFLIEDKVGIGKGVAGGNIIILAESHDAGLEAAMKAVEAAGSKARDIVLPFPGGIVRSGSKVGSLKYPKFIATTNHLLCPTLREKVKDTLIPPGVRSVFEIVINGLNVDAVKLATGHAILAAASVDGVVKITSANYGGRLGPYKIYTHEAVKMAKGEPV